MVLIKWIIWDSTSILSSRCKFWLLITSATYVFSILAKFNHFFIRYAVTQPKPRSKWLIIFKSTLWKSSIHSGKLSEVQLLICQSSSMIQTITGFLYKFKAATPSFFSLEETSFKFTKTVFQLDYFLCTRLQLRYWIQALTNFLSFSSVDISKNSSFKVPIPSCYDQSSNLPEMFNTYFFEN